MAGKLETEYVTVEDSDDLSSVIDLRSRILRGVIFPADWEGSANVGYAVSLEKESGVFYPVEDFGHGSDADTVFVVEGGRSLGWAKMAVGGSQSGHRQIALLTEDR